MLKLPHQLICLLLVPLAMNAQTTDSLTGELPPDFEYMVEELTGSYEENVDASDLVYENSPAAFKRIDLNTPDPFILAEKLRLNPGQIQNLVTYIREYGPLLTVYELKAIRGFDSATIQRILPGILIKPKEEKVSLNPFVLIKQMKGTLLIRYGRILEPQAGYLPAEDQQSSHDQYLGDPSRVLVRFNVKAAGRVSLGLLAEKDAGEQLFKGTQKKGFDLYKAYLVITLNKVLKSLIIGDYQLGFGQGLTINTSAMMTASRGLYQPYKFSNPIRPNTSSNESGGLRGMAADFKKGKISWTLFFSGKKLDARLNTEDTTEQVEALITTGYHRTIDEISNKNRVQSLVYGSHASYKNHFLQAGVTCFQSSFQPDFLPQNELYRRFMDPGGKITSVGADFRLLLPHVMVFGEFACRVGKDAGMIARC